MHQILISKALVDLDIDSFTFYEYLVRSRHVVYYIPHSRYKDHHHILYHQYHLSYIYQLTIIPILG
jgi:hypothetical protein